MQERQKIRAWSDPSATPPIRAMPERTQHFFLDVFPNLEETFSQMCENQLLNLF